MTAPSPHLDELKTRLIRYAIVLGGFSAFCCWFSNDLYQHFAQPLLTRLPEGSQLVATHITAPFMVPLKFAIVFALLLTLPYLWYELWQFIKTGLYPNEQQLIWPFLLCGLFLFYGGVAFAYGVICPAALQFFTQTTPDNIALMIDIDHYSSFMLSICCYAGLAFQTPIITFGAIQLNCVSIPQMIYFRKYVVTAAFVVGMLLTPPDVVSQILLALPMWGLFELGIVVARLVRGRQERAAG